MAVQPAPIRRDSIAGAILALILAFFGRQLADARMTPVDSDRWNQELAEDLFPLTQEIVSREGEIEIQRFMGSGFDNSQVENYLARGALLFAQNVNDGTAALIDKAMAEGASMEEARAQSLAGDTARQRAETLADGKAGHLQSFSSMEAAKQRGGEYTKTWISSGLPDSRHNGISGETIPMWQTFSNGLQYPHDPAGPAHETANCRCRLRINGGPTLEMLGASGEFES